jgi:hypothetical protein
MAEDTDNSAIFQIMKNEKSDADDFSVQGHGIALI